MPGMVDPSERKRRTNVLRILSQKKKEGFYSNACGQFAEVLFENSNNAGEMRGFSSEYIRVKHPFIPELANKFTKVRLLSNDGEFCSSEILENKTITV
jgi:threonylcarbamoyladenosine tRNA methylthiotransferase MtaB